MVSTTGEHYAYFELDEALHPMRRNCRQHSANLSTESRRIASLRLSPCCSWAAPAARSSWGHRESREADSLGERRANPCYLRRRPGLRLARRRNYIHGGCDPLPENAFGYVPTPALVAPIEFTLNIKDYATLGGYMDHVRSLDTIMSGDGRRHVSARPENPWPLSQQKARRSDSESKQ